ncbi:MAG: hypothetical protein JO032_06780 [Alphaproteobacteria bacterium]|nr:hypothetical protein [Alphaproteobacteria bacterium]
MTLGHRCHELRQLDAAHRAEDPGRRRGPREIDRDQAGMRHGAATSAACSARQREVGDKLLLAGQQPAILAPRDGAVDPGLEIAVSSIEAAHLKSRSDVGCFEAVRAK